MNKKRVMAAGLSIALACSLLSGCRVKTDTPVIGQLLGLQSDEIFKIGDIICSEAEVKLVLMDKTNKYMQDFGEDVSTKQKIGDTTLKEYIKQETKNDISVMYTMSALADKNSMTLSDEEKNTIRTAANNYFKELTKEEIEYTGSTSQTVETLYQNYYKANKIYGFLTKDVDTEISDEEARVIKIQYIYIDTSKTEASEAKSTLEEVIGLVKGGYQEFSKEAKQYSDNELTEMKLKKNEAAKDYEKAAFDLSDGKMSSIITQDEGLYLLYCENSYLKDETAKNKKDIIQSDKNSHFKNLYDEYTKDVIADFNTRAWEKIELPSGENISSCSLLEGLELK